MDLQALVAQWSGRLPDGFVPPAVMRREPPQCVQHRCRKPASLKANGEYATSCESCRIRGAQSCKRRRRILVAQGGCRRCAYRKRLEGDFLCQRCRDDRDTERAQKCQDAIDAFAAKPETAPRQQPGHGRVAVDRPPGPESLGSLLVAAARSAAQGRADARRLSPLRGRWRWSPYNRRLHRRY